MEVQKLLGAKQMVMESLCGRPVACRSLQGSPKTSNMLPAARLNLQLLMESDAFVCTWTSNWYGPDLASGWGSVKGSRAAVLACDPVLRCRLVDELRMTARAPAHLCTSVNCGCPHVVAPEPLSVCVMRRFLVLQRWRSKQTTSHWR